MTGEESFWLKNFIQEDLYFIASDKAIPVIEQPGTLPETVKVSFNYLGKSDSKFLVLVHSSEEEYMPSAHLKSFENILGRKNMALEDAVILNMSRLPEHTYEAVTNYFKPEKILIMGADALPGELKDLRHNTVEKRDIIKVLFTFSFDEMDSDEKKRAFWNQMKNF